MQRVYDYLSHQFWWRRVSQNGQVSLGGQRYGIGTTHAGQDIRIEFDADLVRFVAHNSDDEVIKRFQPKQLAAAHITGLGPEHE